MLPVTAQAIISAEKLKVTYFKLSWIFLGGGEDKLVLPCLDIRNNNHAVVYSEASNLSVFIIFFFSTTESHERDVSPHKSLVPRNSWQQQLAHPYQPPPAEKSPLKSVHFMGNESKQWKNFKSWRQIPFPSIQSRNHSSVMDSYAPDSEINSRLMLRGGCGMQESPVQVPHPNQEH